MNTYQTAPTCVLGAGSWGTALAIQLARAGQPVKLWEYQKEQAERIESARENSTYLPGAKLPDSISVFSDLEQAINDCRDILIVVPSHAFRETVKKIKPFVSKNNRFIWGTKGLDPKTGHLLHTVLQSELGGDSDRNYFSMAVLSGPSFAKEVAHDLPTAVTIAGNDADFNREFADKIHSEHFRPYTNDDLIGVQLAGAMKNPIAVATGICDGLDFGANARCALITRGLAEITRLGVKLGGQPSTFAGLAGMGDLVLTCTYDLSRNRRFGLALGKGVSIEEALNQVGQVVEGHQNAYLIKTLADEHGVAVPIVEQVCLVFDGKVSPRDAAEALMGRELHQE